MNKKLLTAALSATLVFGAGVQSAHADDVTIPTAPEDNQTVNVTTGGVANTGNFEKEETEEKIKTTSTLDPNQVKEKPATPEETTPQENNNQEESQPQENENVNTNTNTNTPADTQQQSGENQTPAQNPDTNTNKQTSQVGEKRVYKAGKETQTNNQKQVTKTTNAGKDEKAKKAPEKEKTEMKAEVKKDKNAGENPKTGVATATTLAATAALASAGFALTKKENK
ncbi:hypothetical protein [Anaerococcus cruorum]|uniref:hypothetical protein n=1 Tax=Anaerococcus sp. WGS1529 TaxID=3366812 RepID=UPI00372CE989